MMETDFKLVGLIRDAESMPGVPVEADVPESQNFSAEFELMQVDSDPTKTSHVADWIERMSNELTARTTADPPVALCLRH